MGKRVGALKFFINSCFEFYVSSQNLIVIFGPGFFNRSWKKFFYSGVFL